MCKYTTNQAFVHRCRWWHDATLQPQGADDWKLYLALSEICEFALLSEYLVGYRQVRGSVSRNIAAMAQSMENVVGWIFERRPNLFPEELKRQIIYHIRVWACGRAFDSSKFGAALYYHAKALKIYPASGLRRVMRGQQTSQPPVLFHEFRFPLKSSLCHGASHTIIDMDIDTSRVVRH
jgi:hypothetical protein